MPSFQPTDEQRTVIDAFSTGKDVTISAGAGCGKSTTLEMLARSTNKRGLLIAFNRAVADEAARKLEGSSTRALNTHRIAYGWARGDRDGSIVLDKMNSSTRISWFQIANSFKIKTFIYGEGKDRRVMDKKTVTNLAIRTLESFFKDGTMEISAQHVPFVDGLDTNQNLELEKVIVPIANKLWKDILSKNSLQMRVTHDAYLKLWAMSKPILPYDFILLDEAQDTNPAVMSVFDLQESQKIAVGDKNQQLFSFNGSVNAMDKFKSEIQVKLQQSWRFGYAIQDAANIYLDQLNADIRLKGNPQVQSQIVPGAGFDPHKSSAVLVRTNAGAIQELMAAQNAHQSVHLIGGNTQFKNLIKGAQELREGKTPNHPDFAGFSTWSDLVEYVEDESSGGADLKVIVDLVTKESATKILRALDSCTANEKDAQTVISTVHKVKGREWDQVRLAEDFVSRARKDDGEREVTREMLMFYYVAVTRAKHVLDPGPLLKDLSRISNRPAAPSEPVSAPQTSEDTHTLSGDLLWAVDSLRGDLSRDEYLKRMITGTLTRG